MKDIGYGIMAKPCPFCGGDNLTTPPGVAVVVCGDCEAAGPCGPTHPFGNDKMTICMAASKWNKRNGEEQPNGNNSN